ncbi:MAG: PAS domain S-box protein [Clostridia bacterium]|nr:PAS domain S-box protein [Clostridia bacterium]
MTKSMLQKLFGLLSVGYASHRLIRNEKGEPVDLIFLDANKEYEKMTGLSAKELSGKNVSELFAHTGHMDFDWALFYENALLAGAENETVRYANIRGTGYKITPVFQDSEHFTVILQNMTDETNSLDSMARQKRKIEAVSTELEIIFNSTHDAMFLVGYDNGKFVYIRNNRVHQELLGYGPEDFNGKTPEELLGEETGKLVKASYLRCVKAEKPITYEETLDLPGGKRDWLTNLSPVWKGGKLRYLVGSRTDITEIRNLRKDKEKLLNRLQSMFAEHAASMLLIDPKTGRILEANPSACDFYGYSRAELIKMNIQSINLLPEDEVQQRRMLAYFESQKYFLFPHRMRNGEIRMVDVYSSPVDYDGKQVLFSIIFDVTDREKYREAMNQERELLNVTLHSIGDGVITTDNNGLVTSLNKAAESVTGWSEPEALGRHFGEIIQLKNEETGKEVVNPISLVMQTGKVVGLADHTILIRKDGKDIPINDSAAPILNETGQSFGVVMVFRDVSQDSAQQKQILFLSYNDTLTGLNNRRFLEEKLESLDTRDQLPLAIVMGDVNGLKITNDVFGHEAGDLLLKKVAETFRENCRKSDVLSRWGGDEFLLLMPRTSLKEAENFIERVKRGFAEKSEGTLQLSVSLGCSVKNTEQDDLKRALREAEEWMYHQKLLEGSSYRNAIISTLLATLYEKSMETEEHAERLKHYCHSMGTALQLSAEDLNELALLAILHDIGKVGIHQSILQKSGPLSLDEWEEMRRHSEIGYRIAQNAPELSLVSDYILSHHERWDGQGYPRNLAGEEIPLVCRILAVADAYDAMTNDRVYRKAISKEDAMAELASGTGTQFDPAVVKLFLWLLENSNALAN